MANAMLDAEPMGWFGPSARELAADVRADFERTLTVLREENSTLRRMVEAQSARADMLLLELTKSTVHAVNSAPINTGGPPVTATRRPTSADPIRGLGNVLDPVKLGHPDGEFTSEAAASLMAAEDDDVAAA